jgi:hypothetical protein
VSGLAVDGVPIEIAQSVFGEGLVDTGGANFLLPSPAYAALTSAVAASPSFQQAFGDETWFSSLDNCKQVAMSREALDAALPKVTLSLGDTPPVSLPLKATQSYLRVRDLPDGISYCPAILDFKTTNYWDIGDVVLRANVTIFDRAGGRMGFAPRGACP